MADAPVVNALVEAETVGTATGEDPAERTASRPEKAYVVVGRALSEAYSELGGAPPILDVVFGVRMMLRAAVREAMDSPPTPPERPFTDVAFVTEAMRFANYALRIYEKSLAHMLAYFPITVADVIKHDWKVSTLRPVYAIVKEDAKKQVIIVIRGTFSLSDAMTDVACAPEPFAGDVAHRGMATAAKWFVDNVMDDVMDALAANPTYSLVITGHSLGAGTASLLTVLLKDVVPRGRLRCWAFATPACVSTTLGDSSRELITTFVNDHDLVPRFSLHACAVGRDALEKCEWREDMKDDYMAELERMKAYLRESPTMQKYGAKAGSAASKLKEKYLAALATERGAAVADAASAAKVVGTAAAMKSVATAKVLISKASARRIIHMTPIGDTVYLDERPNSTYTVFSLSPSMARDHSMDLYVEVLEKALARINSG